MWRYTFPMTRNPEDIPLLFPDPVIEAYLKDVDRTLIRSNLQRSVAERFDRFASLARGAQEILALARERNRRRAA